jgi:hypothetical protein
MLYLHIGTHKTGTSALQAFLVNRAEALGARGLHYVQSGLDGGNAHHALPWSIRGLYGGDADVWENVRAELAGLPDTNAVISTEGLWFAHAAEAKAQLEGVRDIRIVMYLRRQDKYLQSLYKQAVTGGRKMDFEEWRSRHSDRGDYLAVVRQWADAFGPESIVLRPYERNGVRVDTTVDFHDLLGIDIADILAQRKPRVSNPSPRLELLEMFRAFNQQGVEIPREKLFWAIMTGKPAYVRSADILTYEQCTGLMEEYDEDNRALTAEFHRDPSTPLFPELRKFAPPEYWSWDSPEYFQLSADFLRAVTETLRPGDAEPVRRPNAKKNRVGRKNRQRAREAD